MRQLRLLFVITLATAPCIAQSLTPLTIYPEDGGFSASFTSRPDRDRSGEALIEVPNHYFRGVGDHISQAEIHGFHHTATDENQATPETYALVFRHIVASSGLPDASNAGRIARIPNLTTPKGLGRGLWRIRDVFQTPIAVATGKTFFAGIDFPANSLWPRSDGHSVLAAWVSTPPGTTTGEHPRASYVRDISWSVTSSKAPWSVGATYLMGCLVDRPVLQIGGLDPNSCRNGPTLCGTPNFGMGGLFPDISRFTGRSDGLVLRIKNEGQPNATVFPFMSIGFAPPVQLPGMIGQMHLDPSVMISTGSLSLVNGIVEQSLLPPGSIPSFYVGRKFAFQSVVMSGVRTFTFSNAQAVEL